ncbi:MAG: hypothetical protein ACI9PU_001951 [Ascidiaceihabitans sp.]
MCLLHTGLTAFIAVAGKRIPAILPVALIPAPDGIVVQVEKFCDPSTAFPVLALATHASLKLDMDC